MRMVFRTDASHDIGSGHVMRCASLAAALRALGDEVLFCCRDHPGAMMDWLKDRGFAVKRIGANDAAETRAASAAADWLVVDHYELDSDWEKAANGAARLLAIDDLGRDHACNLLLDQNYDNPLHRQYRVPEGCETLLGPHYALVRPEFAQHRQASLARSRDTIARVLIFMSGGDTQNETGKALQGFAQSRYRAVAVDVVIGSSALHAAEIAAACAALPRAKLHVQTPHMARLMTEADLMLCAAGSTTWERCTLGVPALLTILADNQLHIAESLAKNGAHQNLGWYDRVTAADYAAALDAVTPAKLSAMSRASAAICDGQGIARVVDRLKH
jgi:UDP-2,4-diacetamido-2,4,6-trideoxy-beta-L-altropyranose hydrolase